MREDRPLGQPYDGCGSVSPACAGIDPPGSSVGHLSPSLPRVRGDRPLEKLTSRASHLSPPRARGSTSYGYTVIPNEAVSPACAGIDPL